jgi:hypothetical protein
VGGAVEAAESIGKYESMCVCVFVLGCLQILKGFVHVAIGLTSLRLNIAVFPDKKLVVVISNYNLPFLYKSTVYGIADSAIVTSSIENKDSTQAE